MKSNVKLAPQHGLSGERYSPEVLGKNAMEHRHRYTLARELAGGKDVLDIACGEGYGADMIASVARSVTGVDIAGAVVAHASGKYASQNLAFRQGSCARIPLEAASVDLVVSFETIEHHDQHREMMEEICRVLRPGGVLLISSPDKSEYSDAPGYANEFHVKELYREEFVALLGAHFRNVRLYGQKLLTGSVIAPIDGGTVPFRSHRGDALADALEDGIPNPEFSVALASDGDLPVLACGLYLGEDDPLLASIKRLRASSFWRMTKPLRLTVHRVRRMFGR